MLLITVSTAAAEEVAAVKEDISIFGLHISDLVSAILAIIEVSTNEHGATQSATVE